MYNKKKNLSEKAIQKLVSSKEIEEVRAQFKSNDDIRYVLSN